MYTPVSLVFRCVCVGGATQRRGTPGVVSQSAHGILSANQLTGVGHVTKVNARAQSGAGRRTLTKSFYYPIRGWAKKKNYI